MKWFLCKCKITVEVYFSWTRLFFVTLSTLFKTFLRTITADNDENRMVASVVSSGIETNISYQNFDLKFKKFQIGSDAGSRTHQQSCVQQEESHIEYLLSMVDSCPPVLCTSNGRMELHALSKKWYVLLFESAIK